MTQSQPDPPGAPPPTRRRRRRWPVVVGVAVLVVGGAAAWLLRPAPESAPETTTRVVEATSSTQRVTVGLTGTLAPRSSAALNFTVPGTVDRIYVGVGDQVTTGQKLARIDDDDLQDALELAEANLDTAEANLDDVSDDGTSAAITAAKAQVRSAKAAVSAAKDDLAAAVLRSTIDGTVASLDLSVGDSVSGGSGTSTSPFGQASSTTAASAQVVVISTDLWNLDASVGSADLASLDAGQPASIIPDGTGDPIEGKVATIGIVATSTSDGTATFPVVVELDGEHPELYSGTTAAAVVTVAEYPDVLTVPTAAITTRDGTAVVDKLVDGRPVATEVSLGRVFGQDTEITAGLAAGDQVQITITRVPAPSEQNDSGGIFGPPRGAGPQVGERPSTPPGEDNGGGRPDR